VAQTLSTQSISQLVNSRNLVDLVNLVKCAASGGSAELELRFVDLQRLYAMVERGRWHSEFRRSACRSSNTASARGKGRFDDLPFVVIPDLSHRS